MVNAHDKQQSAGQLQQQQQQPQQKVSNKQNENLFKNNDEDFFELLTRSQSKRMDDQRCTLKLTHAESVDSARKPLTQHNINATASAATASAKENRNALLEMIADFQSERMDEQRALLPGLKRISLNNAAVRPGVNADGVGAVDGQVQSQQLPTGADGIGTPPDDAFLDMLMRCQGSRIEEQRSELPTPNITMDAEAGDRRTTTAGNPNSGATVPDEDFFSLIMRLQGGRMEDQRATVPLHNINNNNNNRINNNNNNQNHRNMNNTNNNFAATANAGGSSNTSSSSSSNGTNSNNSQNQSSNGGGKGLK